MNFLDYVVFVMHCLKHENETAVSDLTDKRIQNNGHKDAHQDWEK